jgi:hypothetical protein
VDVAWTSLIVPCPEYRVDPPPLRRHRVLARYPATRHRATPRRHVNPPRSRRLIVLTSSKHACPLSLPPSRGYGTFPSLVRLSTVLDFTSDATLLQPVSVIPFPSTRVAHSYSPPIAAFVFVLLQVPIVVSVSAVLTRLHRSLYRERRRSFLPVVSLTTAPNARASDDDECASSNRTSIPKLWRFLVPKPAGISFLRSFPSSPSFPNVSLHRVRGRWSIPEHQGTPPITHPSSLSFIPSHTRRHSLFHVLRLSSICTAWSQRCSHWHCQLTLAH